MDLQQLRYFVAVAEELSFSRAATRAYVSQPALSQQIRKLEAELGVTLLQRSRRRVELTAAGAALLEGARRGLAQLEEARRLAREAGGAEGRRLRVGFPRYANYTAVGEVLRQFRARYAGTQLEQHEVAILQETAEHAAAVRAGTLDCAFVLLPGDVDGLALATVARIPLCAALPQGHPLAAGAQTPLGALAGEALILYARHFHPWSYDYIVSCCRAAGFSPRFVQANEPQLYSGDTTYRMVASGMGIALVARPALPAFQPPGVVVRPLCDPTPVLALAAAWRPENRAPQLRDFIAVVAEHAAHVD